VKTITVSREEMTIFTLQIGDLKVPLVRDEAKSLFRSLNTMLWAKPPEPMQHGLIIKCHHGELKTTCLHCNPRPSP